MNLEVDFKGVIEKQDVIKRLVSVFKLPNSSDSVWNWDAFEDYFTNLDPDSELIRNSQPKPNEVDLIVRNAGDVKKISEDDYRILMSVFDNATKIENRGDEIHFSYSLVE